jgi:hypothetical protein
MIWLYIVLADLYLFFIMYVASMAMIRAHAEKKLNGLLWVLCLPFVAVSIVLDFINNLIVFTLLFAELPREWLVTDRLKRHARQHTFRGKIARWLDSFVLAPFDHTGSHLD